MDERFPDEFVTWCHLTPIGVKVDEIFGMDSKTGKTWIELARQIYAEQGEPNYRIISHFENGAPYLEGYHVRISVTHTSHFMAVASLPKTPEIRLDSFNPRSAMGIDAEPLDRDQVIKVREKFLSDQEMAYIPADNLTQNILAWTCKEALYKSALTPGLDLRNDIILISLPKLQNFPNIKETEGLGKAKLIFPGESGKKEQEMRLYSYESYGCCVSIAISPKCAKFGRTENKK